MNIDNQKRILLVEDDTLISIQTALNLKDYGYDVLSVFNGKKAIEIINNNKNKIDLILMDINLESDLDGSDTAKIILKDHEIPVLFLSSHIEREIVENN